MNDLRKKVLISNLKDSLKYKLKNNNDIIDILYDDIEYCYTNKQRKFYLKKINYFKNKNEIISDLVNDINYYYYKKH